MFKKLVFILILLLWPALGFAGEYWLDNSTYEPDKNGNMPPVASGTKIDPFGCVKDLKTVVSANSAHTIHIIGSMKPYEGGLGGYGLAKYYFGNCTVITDETKFPVMFKATRTIKATDLITVAGKYNIPVNNKFNGTKYRFCKDESGNLVLTRPGNLKKDTGYLYDKAANSIEIDVNTAPTGTDLNNTAKRGIQ